MTFFGSTLLRSAEHTLGLRIEQLFPELRPVVLVGFLLDDNLFPIIRDLEDDVFGALAEFELVEGANALGCDADSAMLLVCRDLQQT